MRRTLVTIGGLVVLLGAVASGIVLSRTLLRDEGIGEAEEDRLVAACVAEGDPAAECVAHVAELVEWGEAEGLSYAELARTMNDEFEEAEQEEAEQQEQLESAEAEADQREVARMDESLETSAAQECAERHGGPCDEATEARDDMALLDCAFEGAATRGLPPGQVNGTDLRVCQQRLDEGALVPRACRDNPDGVIAVDDYGGLVEVDAETVPCSGPLQEDLPPRAETG